MQQWEYCYVTTDDRQTAMICYYRTTGIEVEKVEDPSGSLAAQGKAIAKLGEEGWEMVDTITFKRPKP